MDGNYKGFPSLGIEYQTTSTSSSRKYLGLGKDKQGVYVSKRRQGRLRRKRRREARRHYPGDERHKVDARGDYIDSQFGRLNMSPHRARPGLRR